MKKTLITRADDCGSSRAANEAILQAVDSGFIRNVSIMAPGPYVEEAARMMSNRKEVCFGLHATLNAEWDGVRWGPVLSKGEVPSLVEKDGFFSRNPALFMKNVPSLEEIMLEIGAQLDKLTRLGFTISYMDSHMLPERYVDGLQQAMDRFITEKGLVNHNFYYNIFPQDDSIASTPGLFEQILSTMDEGQYLLVSHPALYSEEMTACGNDEIIGEQLARGRDWEARFLVAQETRLAVERNGFQVIRYDEAVPLQEQIWFNRNI